MLESLGLDFGTTNLVLGSSPAGFGLSYVPWSWHNLLNVGKSHLHEVFAASDPGRSDIGVTGTRLKQEHRTVIFEFPSASGCGEPARCSAGPAPFAYGESTSPARLSPEGLLRVVSAPGKLGDC